MKTTEYALSVAVADYLRAVLPPEVLWSTIGHGGGGKVRGAKLKRAGLRPGIADLMICWRVRQEQRVAWIELKAPAGHVSMDQVAFCHLALAVGHYYRTARSVKDVELILAEFCVPTRGRIAA